MDHKLVLFLSSKWKNPNAKTIALSLFDHLSEENTIIVSGISTDFEKFVQKMAIKYNFPSICVLSYGLNHLKNDHDTKDLIKRIRESQSKIISPFPKSQKISRGTIKYRNKVMVEISDVVVLVSDLFEGDGVEACIYAQEIKRPVFVVPSNFMNYFSYGPNFILKEGANLISNPRDLSDFLLALD